MYNNVTKINFGDKQKGSTELKPLVKLGNVVLEKITMMNIIIQFQLSQKQLAIGSN